MYTNATVEIRPVVPLYIKGVRSCLFTEGNPEKSKMNNPIMLKLTIAI